MKDKVEFELLLPKYAFWDVDRTRLDPERDKVFIISRLFERGKLDDVLSITVFYGRGEARRALVGNKYLSRQGVFLAHTLLDIPLQDFKAKLVKLKPSKI